MNREHFDAPSPDPTWRCAVLFERPQDTEQSDYDPVAVEFVDGYCPDPSELTDAHSHLGSLQWQCPWVAAITRPEHDAPSDDQVMAGLQAVSALYPIRAVAFFGGTTPPPAFQWWSPEVSRAITDYRWSGQLAGKIINTCGTEGRAGMPLQSNAQLRGVVAWFLHLSIQPEWNHLTRGTFEVLASDQSRARVTIADGQIVGATAGEAVGLDAARVFFAAETGDLWYHVEPLDTPGPALSFDALLT